MSYNLLVPGLRRRDESEVLLRPSVTASTSSDVGLGFSEEPAWVPSLDRFCKRGMVSLAGSKELLLVPLLGGARVWGDLAPAFVMA